MDNASDVPYPPRYWWLTRSTIASLMLIAALVALRLWWGWKASQLLAAEIAAYHARGEPLLPEDFAPQPISDAENGALYLKQAADAIDGNVLVPASSSRTYPDYPPFPAFWSQMAHDAVAADQKSLALAREAQRCPRVDWGINYRSPIFSVLLTHLNKQRELTNLLGDAALYEHLQGNDAAAVDHLLTLTAQVRAIDHEPFIINHLVAIGIQALGNHRTQVIAPGLRIEGRQRADKASKPASRAQVQLLIRQLLDEDASGGGIARALQGEQMWAVDTLRTTGRGCVLRPMFDLEARRVARETNASRAAASNSNWPAVNASLAAMPVNSSANLASVSQLFSAVGMPAIGRAIETHFRVVADRRMTAVSLAARLYQIDHDGKWPRNLDDLVPEYLVSVPLDPFANDGRKLGYTLAEGGKRPVVYSVAYGAANFTKADLVFAPTPMCGWQSNVLVQCRDLSRFTPPPATQPTTDSSETEKN